MTKFGLFLWHTYVISRYQMKGSQKHYSGEFIFNWWHPLAWVMIPVTFILSILIEGLPRTLEDMHHLGFKMNPWFAKNGKEIEWINRYDD